VARQLAEDLGKELGQPVVIDNKPGANGIIAAEALVRAAPDGHVLMMSWIGNATSKGLTRNQSFDIDRDFVHITQMVAGANVLVVNPATGFKTVQELVAFAKSNPGKLSYASAGNGTSGHLAMELLKQRAGIFMVHVPYRGGAPALNDVLAGHVGLMFINQDAVIPHLKTGKLVALAITSPARNARFPDLPTIAESGYPGFEATAWAGLSAPRGTPAAVVERIHAAAVKAMQGAFKAKQEATGAVVVASSPAQYTAFVRREVSTWTEVITSAGIKAD
jgi:tripartite-type tricarboxylate transporter receptor subunit TctC